MFLGFDTVNDHLYFLTNKKFANPESVCTDPVEARLSSPALVKRISVKQLQSLRKIQNV